MRASAETYYYHHLKRCIRGRALAEGKQWHGKIVASGLDSAVSLANALLEMYTKCGTLNQARRAFDRMPSPDSYAWNAIITSYAKYGHGKKAFILFDLMLQQVGVTPDKFTLVGILKACAALLDLERGRKVHCEIKQGHLDVDIFVWNALIDMYSKCACVGEARQVFDAMRERDAVSWNAMIAGYAGQEGQSEIALSLFKRMREEGVKPDKVTFANILKVCGSSDCIEMGAEIHASIVRDGFDTDVFLWNSLIDMYAKCRRVDDARWVFDEMRERDVVSWNAMIAGYVRCGRSEEAVLLFEAMPCRGTITPNNVTFASAFRAIASIGTAAALERGKHALRWLHVGISDTFVLNALVDMLAKCGSVDDARCVFDKMQERERDVVSYNAMIAGYTRNKCSESALAVYDSMQTKPNETTFMLALQACRDLGSLERGRQIHSDIRTNGFHLDITVANALIDMYAKCGNIDNAYHVFDGMRSRDIVSWTTIIAGYCLHGHVDEALSLFERMQRDGVKPNKATFTSVLSACSHLGLAEEGRKLFDLMCEDHSITPSTKHYACMVDLLGRMGHLVEAEELINKMPMQPDAVVWTALLGACRSPDGNNQFG